MFGCGDEWIAVLPDCESSVAAAEPLHPSATTMVTHISGRPWLIGRSRPSSVTVGQAGATRVAVFGCCPATSSELADVAARIKDVSDVSRLASWLPGSFHLLASVGGTVRVQGSASGLRRVFSARVGGIEVASSRADILATLTEAQVDQDWLAVRLLYPALPYPVGDTSPWRGINVLPPDSYLCVDRAGAARVVRWWNSPEPSLPLGEGALALREALTKAVMTLTASDELISCDLSGGLDSSSVCHLAARTSKSLLALTTGGPAVFDEEMSWADSAAVGLDHVTRVTLPAKEMPLPFDGLAVSAGPMDEPFTGEPIKARLLAFARHLTAHGSRLHLTGHGGDEILVGSKTYLRTLIRSHPRRAIQHARGHSALHRWPMMQLLHAMADRRSYRVWLRDEAADIITAPRMEMPRLGWSYPPFRLPAWATTGAVDAVRDILRATAGYADPLSSIPGQHEVLDRVRNGARLVRQDQQVMARAGLTMAAPYLDDRVIEACLSVRLDERSTPWAYKPILVEAMSDLLPSRVLNRTTKTDGSADHQAGLQRNRAELLALFEESHLAEMGMIDANKICSTLRGPYPPNLWPAALWQTLACEIWLRDAQYSRTGDKLIQIPEDGVPR
jgi:asparagine synthase (glutamine-hydrolysing)